MYIFSSGLSCVCCLVIGLSQSLTGAVIMRSLAGLLSAVPSTIVGGSIEDMFNSQARIWVVFFWTVASNIGLIFGPIMSSHITEFLNWYDLSNLPSRTHAYQLLGDGSSTHTQLLLGALLSFFVLFENRGHPTY